MHYVLGDIHNELGKLKNILDQIHLKQSNCSFRMAAYIIALRRLIHTEEIKGIFP